MIEPEHIDELVRLTKSGALTWRKTPEGVTEAEDVVYRYHLLPDGATLIRVGRNPFALENGGMSRTSEMSVARIRAPVVRSVALPPLEHLEQPQRNRQRSRRRTRTSRKPVVNMKHLEEQAKHGRVGVEQ